MQRHYPLNPTTGLEDPSQLPWQNGQPSSGTEGSYPPFALCTDPQEEILSVLAAANITPSEADLTQLLEAIRALIAEAAPNVPTYTGTEGVKIVSGVASADIPDLTEEDTLAPTDLVMFYQEVAEGGEAAGHHRKTSFANFAAKVLALIPPANQPLALNESVFATSSGNNVQIPNNVATAIAFPQGNAAFGSMSSDGTAFRFSVAGRYIVSAQSTVAVGSNVGNVNSQCLIYQNGGEIASSYDNSFEAGGGTITPTVTVTVPVIAEVGDTIQVLGVGYAYGTFYNAAIEGGSLRIASFV